MLAENRKRQRSQGDDKALLMPQAKRSSTTAQCSDGSREAWESESSSSDSSGVSSPEHAAGTSSSASSQNGAENLRTCSPHSSLDQSEATTLGSYEHINRVLREAHFQSLENRDVLFFKETQEKGALIKALHVLILSCNAPITDYAY